MCLSRTPTACHSAPALHLWEFRSRVSLALCSRMGKQSVFYDISRKCVLLFCPPPHGTLHLHVAHSISTRHIPLPPPHGTIHAAHSTVMQYTQNSHSTRRIQPSPPQHTNTNTTLTVKQGGGARTARPCGVGG